MNDTHPHSPSPNLFERVSATAAGFLFALGLGAAESNQGGAALALGLAAALCFAMSAPSNPKETP